VEFEVDVRAVQRAGIEAIWQEVLESLDRIKTERDVATSTNRHLDEAPEPMSVVVRDAATNAAKQADLPSMDFHSGAVHDSMQVAAVTQAGMLLAPSRDGISHSPREWTAWSECADPTRGLAGTLAELAEAR